MRTVIITLAGVLLATVLIYNLFNEVEVDNVVHQVMITQGPDLQPRVVKVLVGQEVEWKNNSNNPLIITGDPFRTSYPSNWPQQKVGEVFYAGNVASGEKIRYSFTAPGRYLYFCEQAEGLVISGVVVVAP